MTTLTQHHQASNLPRTHAPGEIRPIDEIRPLGSIRCDRIVASQEGWMAVIGEESTHFADIDAYHFVPFSSLGGQLLARFGSPANHTMPFPSEAHVLDVAVPRHEILMDDTGFLLPTRPHRDMPNGGSELFGVQAIENGGRISFWTGRFSVLGGTLTLRPY